MQPVAAVTHESLARIVLHDKLLLDVSVDVRAGRHLHDLCFEKLLVEFEPARNAPAFRVFDQALKESGLCARLDDGDLVARPHLHRWNVDAFAIEHEVPMANELTRLRARGRKVEPVNNVVEPRLEQGKQGWACLSFSRAGLDEVVLELLFENTVDAAHFLLL